MKHARAGHRGRSTAQLALAVVVALAIAVPAYADDPQPSPDVGSMAATYAYKDGGNPPPGAGFKFGTVPNVPGDQIPQNASMPPQPTAGKRYYNPSGLFLAYDTNVFETLFLPYRAAGDQSASDPPGNGGNPLHGFCAPGEPSAPGPEVAAGRCPNHQLEYLDYYEEAMRDILGDFGVTVKRYPFESPGSINTDSGRSYNIAAIVPGADHPEQSIVVSGHYDQTRDGPASAWDSAEGHAEVIRMAKIMSDYWRATGTRPSVTVKFAPWDQEESGLLGSIDYVENIIPPGEELKVRGYFNVDPCGGGYPAFRRGVPAPGNRVPASVQVADPELFEDKPEIKARFEKFNARSDQIVDEVFGYLDDRLLNTTGQPEIFISDPEAAAEGKDSHRDETPIGTEGPLLFTSDYANFEAVGIPFFNFGPDYTGPGNEGSPNSPEGIAILHTPNDNLRTLNALTSFDQTGSAASEGWAKGQEMCAQTEAWYMLQPEMGGAQTATGDVVAYYEALPNEALQRQRVRFDADGSYQYADASQRSRRSDADLTYEWDFGDGQTGTGKTVEHAYARIGRYRSKLTVRNGATGEADTMELPITVIGSNFAGPELAAPPAEDPDGSFPLSWEFSGTRSGFSEFVVEESDDVATVLTDDAEQPPANRWNVTREPEAESRIEPWQPSDSATPKARGNQARSGRRSFWAGVKPQDFPRAPVNARTVMTLKDPITVPKAGGDVQLSYWSLFQNEGDDQGRVEIAEVGPDPSAPLEWEPIDVLQATNTDVGETDPFIFSPADPPSLTQEMSPRRVNLAAFKGSRLLVRFVYQAGDADRAASQPAGWYVDDIRVQAGTWRPIGTSGARTFEVFGKERGTYSYRVKAVYADGIETAPSNWETVRVTRGIGTAGSATACQAATGFGSLAVRPRGRGLDVRVKRRVRRPFTVTVERVSTGSRISKARRVAVFRRRNASFRWSGRGRKVGSGYYTVRVSMAVGRRSDVRRFAFQRKSGRFKRRPTYSRRDTCRTLGSFKLSRPVFGGRKRNPVRAGFRLFDDAEVSLTVKRGRRTVRTFAAQQRRRGVPYKIDLSALSLPRGDYRVTIVVRRGQSVTRSTLVARRL